MGVWGEGTNFSLQVEVIIQESENFLVGEVGDPEGVYLQVAQISPLGIDQYASVETQCFALQLLC